MSLWQRIASPAVRLNQMSVPILGKILGIGVTIIAAFAAVTLSSVRNSVERGHDIG
ncbi:MAG TPA: hypothetical protein QGH10_14460 [Armatimonadota bacterium]|nr:hypothetical protein [Armatimonadota bacterium]